MDQPGLIEERRCLEARASNDIRNLVWRYYGHIVFVGLSHLLSAFGCKIRRRHNVRPDSK